jgi:hypothetical protein
VVGRWRPGDGSGCGDEAGCGAVGILCPELARVQRGGHDGQLAFAVEGDDGAVEPDVDLDPLAGIARGTGSPWQLEDSAIEVDRVVAGDLAAVLEDEDPLEPDLGRDRPPGGDRIGRRDGEAGVEAEQVGAEEGVRGGEVVDAGEPELDDEPILERPPQPFDPALRLGGARDDRADAELDEGPSDLAELAGSSSGLEPGFVGAKAPWRSR